MNETWLVFKHEFQKAIKRGSFIVLTLAVPIFALLGIGVFKLATNLTEPPPEEVAVIGYVDEVGIFADQTETGFIDLVPYESQEAATEALISGDVAEYLLIPADFMASGTVQRYLLEGELITPSATENSVRRFLSTSILADKVAPDTVNLIVNPLNFEAVRLNEDGDIAPDQSGIGSNLANVIIPSVFSLLMAFALLLGAVTLTSGLGEEKESRLIEVLFSSTSVSQLLTGKVLALGAAGLLQVLAWLISAPLLLRLASSAFGGILNDIQIPTNFLVLGIVYFVLGYLLFAVLSIGAGAISAGAREAGQLSAFYTIAVFIPLWFAALLFNFPDSAIWVVLTIFPLTAPIQTMMRLGVSDVPLWQIVVSIVVLGLSVIAGLNLAIRIFRVNMLLHGKRPSLSEIVQNLRYA